MPVQEMTATPMAFMQWIVWLELVLIFGIGFGWIWCCVGLRARVKKLELENKALKPVIDHYRDFVETIVECLSDTCGAGGSDPDWPPPDVPEWPGQL